MVIAVTCGGELLVMNSVIGKDVVVAPRLSEAKAVSVCEPTLKVTERLKGLDDTLPRAVAPSKNSTLVTLPSLSLAAAWIVIVAGPTTEIPSVGLVMATTGGELLVTVTPGTTRKIVPPPLVPPFAVVPYRFPSLPSVSDACGFEPFVP